MLVTLASMVLEYVGHLPHQVQFFFIHNDLVFIVYGAITEILYIIGYSTVGATCQKRQKTWPGQKIAEAVSTAILYNK